MILLKLTIGKTYRVFTPTSVYAPKQGRSVAEKERFYDQLQSVTAMVPHSEVLSPIGDWNEGVHDGCGYKKQNAEGDRFFSDAHRMVICVTLFKKGTAT